MANKLRAYHDSLFTNGSNDERKFLERLRTIIREHELYSEKQHSNEFTLRVYPEKRHQYPLLNPRLYRKGENEIDYDHICINVYTQDSSGRTNKYARDFIEKIDAASLKFCKFVPINNSGLFGQFIITIFLNGSSIESINFSNISQAMDEISIMFNHKPRSRSGS